MNVKPRMTKQGIRDLNYYGPKPVKAPAASRPAASDTDGNVDQPIVPKKSDTPPA